LQRKIVPEAESNTILIFVQVPLLPLKQGERTEVRGCETLKKAGAVKPSPYPLPWEGRGESARYGLIDELPSEDTICRELGYKTAH
jgi:hypothetical protein